MLNQVGIKMNKMYMINTHTSQFPLHKRLLLRGITKLQKLVMDWDNTRLYYDLAKLHFKLWFGKDLKKHVIAGTSFAKLAARRHGRLVLKKYYPDMPKDSQASVIKNAMYAFMQNIRLETDLLEKDLK